MTEQEYEQLLDTIDGLYDELDPGFEPHVEAGAALQAAADHVRAAMDALEFADNHVRANV